MRHPLRVGTPIRLRITRYMATSMKAMLPPMVISPIRRSRLIATQMPSGTMTSDASSFTSSDSTTNTTYRRHFDSSAA